MGTSSHELQRCERCSKAFGWFWSEAEHHFLDNTVDVPFSVCKTFCGADNGIYFNVRPATR